MKIQKGSLFCFLFFLFLFSYPIFAEEVISVYIDNEKIEFASPPMIKEERTLVPMREIFERLGFEVEWNQEEKSVIGTKGGTRIKMQIDQNIATKNGKEFFLEMPPVLIESRVMVPLRFVAESTEAEVIWNQKSRSVNITSKESLEHEPILEDSVVLIQTDKLQGSGVILSRDGLLVTNFHVLEGAKSVQIIFQNGRQYSGPVKVVGYHVAKDLVAIKIDAVSLYPVRLGDSTNLTIGQPVTAIGSPLGSKNLSTSGVILGISNGILKISAPLDYGSSGGALFNTSGELIGITTSYDKSNQYFAVPVNTVKRLSTKGDFLLSSLKEISAVPSKVENLEVHYETEKAYLSWDYQYGADYYHVYKLNAITKEYERETNPNNKTENWYWGYPYAFGIEIDKLGSAASFKVAAVRKGKISPLSDSVTVNGIS